MIFTKEFLLDSLESEKNTVTCDLIDTSRWAIHYRRIFRHEGKFYQTYYELPATECQEYDPYGYDGNNIECAEVFPAEKTMTVYLTQEEIDDEAKQVAPHR